jgi:hypothetical protein
MTSELNVLVLFECSTCGQSNAYAAGRVIKLDHEIMNDGSEEEKQQHVLEVVQKSAVALALNVLGNLDTIININAKISVPEAGGHIETSSGWTAETTESEENSFRQHMLPSTSQEFSDISSEEVRDFVAIDLNLIDDKEYFEKFFGDQKHKV